VGVFQQQAHAASTKERIGLCRKVQKRNGFVAADVEEPDGERLVPQRRRNGTQFVEQFCFRRREFTSEVELFEAEQAHAIGTVVQR